MSESMLVLQFDRDLMQLHTRPLPSIPHGRSVNVLAVSPYSLRISKCGTEAQPLQKHKTDFQMCLNVDGERPLALNDAYSTVRKSKPHCVLIFTARCMNVC